MPSFPPLPKFNSEEPDEDDVDGSKDRPSSQPSVPGMIPAKPGASYAFSGGLPGVMQSLQQVEAGVKGLASQMPSLAPFLAQFLTQLRIIVPNMNGAGATSQPGMPGPPEGASPDSMAANPLPPPPQ